MALATEKSAIWENKRKNQRPFEIMPTRQSYFTKSDPSHYYGYLWSALTVLGIDVFPTSKQKAYSHVIHILKKYFFPFVFFFNFFQCFIRTWCGTRSVDYETILDITLQINPVCLWISVFYNKRSIEAFVTRLTPRFKTPLRFRRNMQMAINIYLLIQFIYVSLHTSLLWYNFGRNDEHFALAIFNFFTVLFHDNAISSVVAVLYCSNCLIFIHLLKTCKNKAKHFVTNPSSSTLTNLLTQYFKIAKCIENFQNLFSTCMFFCMMQCIFSLSFDILHWVADKKIGVVVMLQIAMFLLNSCMLILSVTVCAGKVPQEMCRIKDILVSANSEYLEHMKDTHFKTLVNLIRRKNVIVLSACDILIFDRSFILKTFGVLTAQTVIFYQFIT